MIAVRVLSAHSLGDSTIATVEIEGSLTVTGVRVEDSEYTGRPVARPPRRPNGSRVLAWSEAVAGEVAAAILAALPSGTVAVSEDPLPFEEPDECPACGGDWAACACDPEEADAAYQDPAA